MNLKIYRKTRYQNIFQHIKNKNYVVLMSKPVKTSISKIDKEKIWKIEDAIKVRDDKKIRVQKGIEVGHKEDFDTLLDKYMFYCKNELKLSYNTLKKKRILYDKYFRGKFERISKISKNEIVSLIDNFDCSLKQKNEILKIIKPFFNWCVSEEIIFKNPLHGVKPYRVENSEMKYWLPQNIKDILNVIEMDIRTKENLNKHPAYIIKMVVLIGFSLGDRIGETRALRFSDINKGACSINIKHSINYDPRAESFLSTTKTKKSEASVFVTEKLISEIDKYKNFLIKEMNIKINYNTPILINPATLTPYSDTRLRVLFNYYIKKAGVPKIRMYDLRHTTATTLMSEGCDMYIIQDKLRHESIRTTIDKYGHITSIKRKEIAKITDKYI